jgi:hypothetical protein
MATSSCMDGRDGAVCHSVRRAFSWVSQLTQQRNINLHRTFIHRGSDTSRRPGQKLRSVTANYMHVRFSDAMLVSPSSTPKDDVLERRDNYYVYLKPSDVTDETILKKVKFSGKPPVWIPMPPH